MKQAVLFDLGNTLVSYYTRDEWPGVLEQAIARWEGGGKYAPVSERVLADIARSAQRDTLPQECTSFNLHFGEQMELAGARVAPAELALSSERVVTVSLYWRALEPVAQNYVLFIHLTDAAGRVHAQRDTESGWGFYPTTTWPVGPLIEDMRSLPLLSDLPCGEYRVRVGWYSLPDIQRLTVTRDGQVLGDAIDVGTIVVR